MPHDSPDDDPEQPIDTSVAGETTRIEAVRYLEGASGHGVLSLVFLCVAAVLLYRGQFGMAVLTGLGAYAVALNGLSIYLWDELRVYFVTRFERTDGGTTRTLTVHRVSPEMKAELASGAVMVGGFIILLGVALGLARRLGSRSTAVLAGSGLAVGTVCALAWSIRRS